MEAETQDRWPVRIVVIGMVLVLIGSVSAMTFLAFTQTPIPDPLSTIAVGALTGTTALLARTSTTPAGGVPVQVMNVPSDPVPVDSAAPAPSAAEGVDDASGWATVDEPAAT